MHDFPVPKPGKAVPYGVFDLAADTGFVTVGSDGDTAAFAVAGIGRWWEQVGSVAYPDATRLLITADVGGSNGYPTGTKVTDAELAAVPREAHRFHGGWNYTGNGTRLKSRPRKRTTTK